jgi:hypothetical protein
MEPVISIHVTHQRGVDAVLTDGSCEVLDQFSQDCYAPGVVTPFISSHAKRHPNLALVVSPSDPWPPHLLQAVEELGPPLRWVPRQFERDAYQAAAPGRNKRRLYRARLLAHLYYCKRQNLYAYGHEAGLEWERQIAQETLDAIEEHQSELRVF